jgi:hypothetical protein
MADSAALSTELHPRQIERQQVRRHRGPHQLPAQQHAQNDGGDRQPLDPAIGLDQLGRRQQLGQDAVLGRRIRRCTQAHHGVGQQRVQAGQHQQTTHHLDGVAHEHDLALGQRIGKRTDKGRQHHVEQGEHGHQRSTLPLGGAARAQQLHGRHKQCVVGERAEKLRRHDGVKTALHRGGWGAAISGTDGGLNRGA